MSKWLNKCTCPVFMVVTSKLCPCVNEYHTICCSHSGILFVMELVEGKNETRQAPENPHTELGNMLGLVLCITRSLRNTDRLVVMYSVLCVLKSII